MTNAPATPFQFPCGVIMKNRFMLSPLTNQQSYEDGQLSDDEFKWLTMRAKGQFGLVMTCASHVQEIGKGFSGQLGIFSDQHIPGHQRLTTSLKSNGSLALIQLHHAGMRSPEELIKEAPVCPSISEKHGARGLSLEEVKQLKADFIAAAVRSKKSGYDGVEVHGAHGYILTQFLSAEINKRTDEYGGDLTNRSRLLFEIVDGIREACGDQFILGVRLSPERFGLDLKEIKSVAQSLIDTEKIDFLDLSLWDYTKLPEDEKYNEHPLLDHLSHLDYKNVKLTISGKIKNGNDVMKVLNSGVDFVTIGRSAILHHDFPVKVIKDPSFVAIATPVSEEYLREEGLGEAFVKYMHRWPDFVESEMTT